MRKSILGVAVAALLAGLYCASPGASEGSAPLKARIKASSQRVRVGEPVFFDGRGSSPGGSGARLTGMYWDFDDMDLVEEDGRGDTLTYVFNHSGACNVYLTVENDRGERDRTVFSVEVLPEDDRLGPSLAWRFENGRTGVFLESPHTWAFRLEWGNQFFFRVDNARGKPVSIKIYGYGRNRLLPPSITPYGNDNTFDERWTAMSAASYIEPDWQPLTDARYTYDADSCAMLIEFTPASECVYLAWASPWTMRDQMAWIDRWEDRKEFRWVTVGLSVEGRPIQHAVLTDPSVDDRTKKVIWITGTQHGYEMASGPVCEGIVKTLFEDSDSARAMLRGYVFHFIPLVNPDAVFYGGYRYNMHHVDLNRNWDNEKLAPWDREEAEPEVAAVKRAVNDWVDRGGRLDLFMDFHCLTAVARNLLLIQAGWDSMPEEVAAGQERFHELLSEKYFWRKSIDSSPSSACSWASREFAVRLGTLSFTPEHCLGWIDPGGKGLVRSTPERFRTLGRDYVWTIRDYFEGK